MSGSSAIYKAFDAACNTTGKVLNIIVKPTKRAFNWASGNKSLQKRHLKRSVDVKFLTATGGFLLGDIGFLAVAGSIALPMAIPVIAAAVVVGFVPARLHAAYLVGKDEARKAKAQKAALKIS